MKNIIVLLVTFFLFSSICLSAEYDYTRAVSTGSIGGFNIDNPYRSTNLDVEVETALPGKTFILRCNGTDAKFIFDVALSGAEQTTLTNTVNDHKNND